MKKSIQLTPDGYRQVCSWYAKAQIDYTGQYVALYTAYNACYKEVTGTTNDRQAISALKKRYIIWDDYCQGKTMRALTPYMERVVELTQREPLASSVPTLWSGELNDTKDWRSLIEYWYQVRCLVVHGEDVPIKYVWLAYETLDVFMGEILRRMQDEVKLQEKIDVSASSSNLELQDGRSGKFDTLQKGLYRKYWTLPAIWQVDIKRI